MTPREELQALRRLAELEAKASGKPAAAPAADSGGFLDWAKKDLAAIPGRVGDLAAGAVRGAGSIGATVLAPLDIFKDAIAGKGLTLESNRQRRADMDGALTELGADTESIQFQAGKLGTEIAGTLGAGGAVANGVRAVAPGLPTVANAVASGGFSTGAPAATTMAGRAADWATRIGGGAVNAGATVGLVDPEQAGTAMQVGAALPVVARVAGAAGNALSSGLQSGSKRLMQSAIKPTLKQLENGDANVAVQTLLDRGISPNKAGMEKIRGLINQLDDGVTTAISGSTATIPKANVLNRLGDTRSTFTNQVAPTADLAAIGRVADDFVAHPAFPGDDLSVQAAQDLKRGTYNALSKKYGQMGGAETEAQKALARGLKEEIAAAVPGVAGLNAEMSKLITTLNVAERRALMEANKNPGGLALLANNPTSWAMFMADRSSAFKAIAARMLNATSGGAGGAVEAIGTSVQNPVLRNALLRPALISSESSP